MARRLNRILFLAAVSGTILLSACGGHAPAHSPGTSPAVAATPAQGTSTGAIPGPTPGSTVTAIERVDAWFADGGQNELDRLGAAIVAVGQADTPGASYAGLNQACVKEAAAVASAQAGPAVPDAAPEASLSSALAEYAKSAADCQAGASAQNVALLNQAAAETRAGTADVLSFDNSTKDAQSQDAQSAAGRMCNRLYQAWKTGPAQPELTQLLAALQAVQVASSGDNLPAMTAAVQKAGQQAGQLNRYPVPACADPGGDFAAILTRVRAAAANAASAKSQPAVAQAMTPLNAVPTLEAQFTDEVKLTTGT